MNSGASDASGATTAAYGVSALPTMVLVDKKEADTVRAGVTGFTFSNYSGDDFWNVLREALYIYRVDRESWRSMQVKGMTCDYSWEPSARAYQQLYEWAIARVRGW